MNLEHLQNQIIELQTQQAYQEDTLHQLNQVIAKQDRVITQLQEQQKMLMKKLDEMDYAAGPAGKPADEKPPHY